MGLHTGTPTVTSEGYVGIDVHRAARVAALANGGQVILSSTTAALLEGEALRDLGQHRLKDFDAPARLFQLGNADFPPLRTPGAVDLPTPATQFLGRERELFDAASLWLDRAPRLMTIVGPGGTGKTRLSIELARFLAEDADGGTVFVPLAPVKDAALVAPLIAERLGASDDDAASIATRIGEKRTHVVLDNVEHLLPGVARELSALVAAAPTLRLLATSREPLRIAGESEFDLAPMVERDAVTLFVERAQAVRPDVVDSPAIHELVRRLDGLPLAIELAAARGKLLGPEQLLERISQRLDLLKGGRDVDERHATLRATIAWSYDLLEDGEQRLFARLGIFEGGCALDAAEAICDADLDTLASLLDKSLVRRRADQSGEQRFWMLETIREFAGERLAESGEEDLLRRRQAGWLLELAQRAGTQAIVDVPLPWDFDLVAPEIDNVRASLAWAAEHEPELGLRLACALESFWVVRDPVGGAAWLERLLARVGNVEPGLRARSLRSLGGSLDIVGEHERSAPLYRESLDLFSALGDPLQAEHMRLRIGVNMCTRGEAAAAWPLIENCLLESRRIGARIGECQALGALVERAQQEGDLDLAIDRALESAAIANELGWAWWESALLHTASELERERGRFDAAGQHARRAFDLAEGLGDRLHTVFAAAELAIVAAHVGDVRRAGRLWGAIEGETSAAPVAQWDHRAPEVEAQLERVAGPAFTAAQAEGTLLSLAEAVGPALT